jgi:hypothetical protein
MLQSTFKAFFAALLLAGTAVAQEGPALTEGHLDYVDANDNGGVSRQELDAVVGQAFSQLDTNNDGSLGPAELTGVLTEAQFSTLDGNGDGSVSRAELANQAAEDFAAADRNRDGQLR